MKLRFMRRLRIFITIMTSVALLGAGCTQERAPARLQVKHFWPQLIAIGPSGHVYVVDRKYTRIKGEHDDGKDTILKFSADGHLVGAIDPPGRQVSDFAVGRDDNVYVLADRRKIFRISSFGKVVTLRTFSSRRHDTDFENKKPFPSGLAIDNIGNIFVVYGTHQKSRSVLRLDKAGRTTAKWSTAHYAGTGGWQVGMNVIAANDQGSVFVLEQAGKFSTIEKFTDSGERKLLWTRTPKIIKRRGLFSALALAMGKKGHVFLLEPSGFVLELTSDGHFIKKFGSGKLLAKGASPVDIAVRGNRLYVLDTSQRKIYKFSLSGKLLSVW